MRLSFVKMHAAGNDYLYVDGIRARIPRIDCSILSSVLSDRHRGVGADGIILILPSEKHDFKMRIFNSDGSEGEMCGNGVRCVGGYVWEHGLVNSPEFTVDTLDGPVDIKILRQGEHELNVQASMLPPGFTFDEIPMDGRPGRVARKVMLNISGYKIPVYGVRVGNPHCVVFVREPEKLDLHTLGPLFEEHTTFYDGANVEFVKIVDERTLRVRVYERGSGETQSCGTGACAAAAWAICLGLCKSPVRVQMPGGELLVDWQLGGCINLSGPVEEIYRGSISVPDIARMRSDEDENEQIDE